ncbi:MAG: hypothetical protein WAY02_01225, partial [Burkholderiaceae bacterium]
DVRLEAACTMALGLGTSKYTHIRDILLNRRDLLQISTATEWSTGRHHSMVCRRWRPSNVGTWVKNSSAKVTTLTFR